VRGVKCRGGLFTKSCPNDSKPGEEGFKLRGGHNREVCVMISFKKRLGGNHERSGRRVEYWDSAIEHEEMGGSSVLGEEATLCLTYRQSSRVSQEQT